MNKKKTLLPLPAFLLLAFFTLWPASQSPAVDKQASESPSVVINKLTAGINRFVLPNGIIGLVMEDHAAPVATVQIWVGTGSIHESEYLGSGLSHAIEHMIFKGTPTRSPTDITREINNAGGDINAYTSLDRTVFLTDLPSDKRKVGLDVLADALMHASFPAEEWKKEKDVILREIAMNNDTPARVVDKLMWATLFTTHPYRQPVIGHRDVFKKLTRNDLVTFFNRNYVPDNMIVVVTGHVNAKEVETEIRKTFAQFERKARAPITLPQEPAQLAPRFVRETGDYNVSRMEWAYPTVPISHPDAPALDLLSTITGQGRSSRLVNEIKEKQKLVHSIDAYSDTLKEGGLWGISAVFSPTNEAKVITAIEKEIASWQDSRFSAGEIEKARRIILNSTLSSFQTTSGQAGNIASGEFYAGDAKFSGTYLKLLDNVTADSLRTVARKYLNPSCRSIAVLAPSTLPDAKPANLSSIVENKPRKIILKCGIPLIVREDHRLPFVNICATAAGGLLTEDDSNAGITQLMSELLTRGTANKSSDDIGLAVESLGASLTTFSDQNSFGISGHCLSQDTETLMDLLADCLLNPQFPENEIAKQKAIQLATLDQQRERPMFIAQEELGQLLFPNHPYRRTLLGTKESIAKIQRSDLITFVRKLVVSGNLVLSIFGDITPSAAASLADGHLRNIVRGSAPDAVCAKATPHLPAKNKKLEPREQAVILMGFPGIDLKDTRRDAVTLLQTAMSGLSSGLGVAVREERGLAYYVGAYQFSGIQPGSFIIYAGTREDAVGEVENLISREVQRITTEGLTPEEFERARSQLIADFDMSLQDNMGLAISCAKNELHGLGYMHPFTARNRLRAVTNDGVRSAAAAILSTNRVAVSIVLPAGKTGRTNSK